MRHLEQRHLEEARSVLCTHFPEPAVGETLFSVCARFHRITALKRPSATAELLFGNPRSVNKRCTPAGLETLVQTLPDIFKESQHVLRNYTHGALYLRFMTKEQQQRCIIACTSPSHYRQRLTFGWASEKFETQHPMRFCVACALNDEAQNGTPIWHLDHQLPGVLICTKHMDPLISIPSYLHRSTWPLPNNRNLSGVAALDDREILALACLADSIKRLRGTKTANLHSLRSAVCLSLEDIGIARASRAINPKSLVRWIDSKLSVFDNTNVIDFTGSTRWPELISGVLGKRMSHHPLRWAMLITAIRLEGGDHEPIYKSIDQDEQISLPGIKATTLKPPPAIAFKAVSEGASISDMCRRLKLPRSVIQRWLMNPDVHDTWSSARMLNIRTRHEESINAAFSPDCKSRQELKRRASGAYQWFLRNEPDYLESLFLSKQISKQLPLFL